MIANILDCWDAAERELGMNPDAGLELLQQFPRVGDLLEAVRTAALALCESPAAERMQEPLGMDAVMVQRLKQIVSVSAIPCGKHAEHELDGGIVYYCPWCEADQLVDEDHPFRFDRLLHLAECPAQWLRHKLDEAKR